MRGAVLLLDDAHRGVPRETLAEQRRSLDARRRHLELMRRLMRDDGERQVELALIVVGIDQREDFRIPDGGVRRMRAAVFPNVFDQPQNLVRIRSESLRVLRERPLHAADHSIHVARVRGRVHDFDGDVSGARAAHHVIGGEDGVAIADGGRRVMKIASSVAHPRAEELTGSDGGLVRGRADGGVEIEELLPGRIAARGDVVQRVLVGARRQPVLLPLFRLRDLAARLVADQRHPVGHIDEGAVREDGGADAASGKAARMMAHVPAHSQRVARLERLFST